MHPLEVERQVGGDDGYVHEVDHVLVLPPVQVLVDVQGLWGGLWSRCGPVCPLPGPPVGPCRAAGRLLPQVMAPPPGAQGTQVALGWRWEALGPHRCLRLGCTPLRVSSPTHRPDPTAAPNGPRRPLGALCCRRWAAGAGPAPRGGGPTRTSSESRNFPNSRWCRSRMEEPWSLARGFWDLRRRLAGSEARSGLGVPPCFPRRELR